MFWGYIGKDANTESLDTLPEEACCQRYWFVTEGRCICEAGISSLDFGCGWKISDADGARLAMLPIVGLVIDCKELYKRCRVDLSQQTDRLRRKV